MLFVLEDVETKLPGLKYPRLWIRQNSSSVSEQQRVSLEELYVPEREELESLSQVYWLGQPLPNVESLVPKLQVPTLLFP